MRKRFFGMVIPEGSSRIHKHPDRNQVCDYGTSLATSCNLYTALAILGDVNINGNLTDALILLVVIEGKLQCPNRKICHKFADASERHRYKPVDT
jgi:hypothetical protein